MGINYLNYSIIIAWLAHVKSGKIAIIAYALGIAVGTVIAMHLESYLTKRKKMGKKANLEHAKKEAELGISPLL